MRFSRRKPEAQGATQPPHRQQAGPRWATTRVILTAVAGLILLGCVGVLSVRSLRWRAHLVVLYSIGAIPDVGWEDVIRFVQPGSAGFVNMPRLIETRNPYAVLGNPRTGPADERAGSDLFAAQCAVCHGPGGSGGAAAPAFIGHEFKRGESDWAIYRNIRYGVGGTAMQAHPLSFQQLWQLVAYLRSLQSGASGSSPTRNASAAAVHVPYDVLRQPGQPAEDWLTYSGSYSSHRHSGLTHINAANVRQLTLRWVHQFDRDPQKIEASPLVSNGVLFMTVPAGRVVALDATTGEQLWAVERPLPPGVAAGQFGSPSNRGVALLDDKVFVGTGDARVIALAAGSGKVMWDVPIAAPDRYYISSAPLAYRDLVVTGVGTKGGGRAFIAAFDAATGRERWRFVAVPGPGEPGNETWAGNSWREGGAPTWMTGSYDPEQDVLFWGAGNPKPDYDPAARRGDNLYSNSVLALQGSTGKLLWYFQFTPADDKDWDSGQIPILADLRGDSASASRLLWANRNGFYYVLDRLSGRYLRSQPFVHQTWTLGIDSSGRPLPPPTPVRAREGLLTYPGNVGGTNWWPPSYDPARGLLFVPILEQGMIFFPSSEASWPKATGKPFYTAVRALNAETGQLVWERRFEPRLTNPEIGGLLSTEGGVVFGSDGSTFFALDAATGKQLWSVQTGGKIGAAPVTYAVNGEQYVVIPAGGDLLAFSLPK